MAGAPVGFPVPQLQEGLDEREALDCFVLDYVDYCTVMGWFQSKAGCKYDDESEDGKAQWKKPSLCMSTLRATLPSKMKRLINPNNKTLGLSEENKDNPVKVIQALIKRFGGSVSVQAERTKMGRMFQSEGESISAWECRVVERAKYCEYGDFEDQACRDRFIAGLVDEALQGKLNTNGHRNKEGNIVEFRAVVEIAKNYESSTDARRLMRQVRGDQEQVNWTAKVPPSKTKSPQSPSGSSSKGLPPKQPECNYCGATPSHAKEKCRAILLKYICRKCGKEGHVARKCLSKPRHVNALNESVYDGKQETYHLFTVDIHSVRTVSVQKGKKFFAAIKLSAAGNCFVWKTLQLDTASTTNTLAVDDLVSMCPPDCDIRSLIKPSSAILHTYGGGVIKPVGQIELVCEIQGKFHTLQFQLLSKDVMGSQPPLLSGSDCIRLGLIEIRRNAPSLHQNDHKETDKKSESQWGKVEESGMSDKESRPTSLNDSPTGELKPAGLPDTTSPVNSVCTDIHVSAVNGTATSEAQVKRMVSAASEVGVSHMPVPGGKLTKAIVLEAFKDVHTGLGTLGPPHPYTSA